MFKCIIFYSFLFLLLSNTTIYGQKSLFQIEEVMLCEESLFNGDSIYEIGAEYPELYEQVMELHRDFLKEWANKNVKERNQNLRVRILFACIKWG